MKSIKDEAEFKKVVLTTTKEADGRMQAAAVALLSRRRWVLWSKRKFCGF